MLRLLVLALLLANGLLLAAQGGLFDRLLPGNTQREPERRARQVNPARVRILPEGVAASAAVELACLQAGPFEAAELAVAERTLRDAGLPASAWQRLTAPPAGDAPAAQYLIVMGRYADAATLQRKQAELRRLRIDATELHDSPELPPGLTPGLALGRFTDAAAAAAALARLVQRGARSAHVVTLGRPPPPMLLRLPTADAAQRAKVAGLQLPSGPGFTACPAAVPASAAGSMPR